MHVSQTVSMSAKRFGASTSDRPFWGNTQPSLLFMQPTESTNSLMDSQSKRKNCLPGGERREGIAMLKKELAVHSASICRERLRCYTRAITPLTPRAPIAHSFERGTNRKSCEACFGRADCHCGTVNTSPKTG